MILASSGPPGGALGGLQGRLGCLLGASWAVLGHPGAILGRRGGFLGELGGILDSLGPSWRPSWTILGELGDHLKRLGGNLGPSWSHLDQEKPWQPGLGKPSGWPAERAEVPGRVLLEKSQNQTVRNLARRAPLWQANRGRRIILSSGLRPNPPPCLGSWLPGSVDDVVMSGEIVVNGV